MKYKYYLGAGDMGGYLKGLFSFLLFTACIFSGAPANAGYITASGCSVSNVGYLTDLAQEYEKRTGTKVFVRGGGTILGIEELRAGKVDFAAACRSRKAGDPEDIQFIQVAWDALVFIVNRHNPLDNISLEQVRAIYAGKITNWKQLKGFDAPIKVFISRARKGLSGVESSTRELVLKGKDPVETRNTMFLASTGIVEQMVDDTPGGFATTGFSSARKRDVKMLKVDGVSPTQRSITNGRYPLKRPLFLLVPREHKADVKKFVDFVLSEEGQSFISSRGVVSLHDMK